MYHRPEGVSNGAPAWNLVDLVGALLGAPDPAPAREEWEAIVVLARRNRLGPLLHRLVRARTDVPEVVRHALREEAARALVTTANHVRALPHVAAGLSGCPWVLLRGPVLGVALYGEVGLRPFIDLDVLVAREDVPRAAEALRNLGFIDQENALPDAYYLRHHLHLHLVRARGPTRVNLELHWAVDHPFRLAAEDVPGIVARAVTVRVEGTGVPAPAPVDLLLTLCQHTVKHVIDLPQTVAAGNLLGLVERGDLLHLLDIALLLARDGDGLDRDLVQSRAEAWGVSAAVGACLAAASGLWPGLSIERLRMALPPPRIGAVDRLVARTLTALPGGAFRARSGVFFRPARLVDAFRYVVPTAAMLRLRYGSSGLGRRFAHAARAVAHLAVGGVEFAYYSLRARASRSRGTASRPPDGG